MGVTVILRRLRKRQGEKEGKRERKREKEREERKENIVRKNENELSSRKYGATIYAEREKKVAGGWTRGRSEKRL